MKTLKTKRLTLRPFTQDDFAAVHSYASNPENIKYMIWGPNTENETQAFLDMAIKTAGDTPCKAYHYAAVLKESGKLIGACHLSPEGEEAEIGWILHRDCWRQGYGFEMANALLAFAFDDLGLRRIIATCDAENTASYSLMEKLGMRREGLFIEARPGVKGSDKKYGDELYYAMLKDDWDIEKEIAHYKSLPVVFDDFIDVPHLSDGVIYLVCMAKRPAQPEKKYCPSYEFAVCAGGEKVGDIGLRLGYSGFGPNESSLYYGGQIGYNIDEKHRGKGYAGRACKLVLPVAKAHGMTKLLITNNHTNTASRRVCEKLGTRFVRMVRLPEWTDLYKDGQRFMNIFEMSVE